MFTHSSSKYLNYLSVCQLMSTVTKSGKGKQGPAESSWAHILGHSRCMDVFVSKWNMADEGSAASTT